MGEEVEIKYRLAAPAEHERLRAALAGLGARPAGARHEQSSLFDTAARDLFGQGSALRLRIVDGGPGGTMTFKGPAEYRGGVKSRQELEVGVSDAGAARGLLEALGYRVAVSYSNDREVWHVDEVEVVLDRLDFGVFCELEGPRDQILELSQRLGLDPARAETASYPELAARYGGHAPAV